MKTIQKVFGAPGTGKTTYLLSRLKELLKEGDTFLKDVVFISFSNPSVEEICERVGIRKGTLPYFRTLHGLALSQLMKQDEEIRKVTGRMFKLGFVEGLQEEFCRSYGIPYEKGEHGAAEALGNRAFSAWTAVVGEFFPKLQDVQACLDKLFQFNRDYGEIIELWLKEKSSANFLDYEDILIEAYNQEIRVNDAKAAFIDEAQDFNRLEFELTKQLIEPIDTVFYAGDDDQAIYGWKMARPEFFLNLEGEEVILPKSWRVPEVILNHARNVIGQVRRRREKKVEPAREGGLFKITGKMDIESVTIEAAKFALRNPSLTVYLLFRTNQMVRTAQRVLINRAVPFRKLKGESLWDKEVFTAWNVVSKLRRGQPLTPPEKSWVVKHLKDTILEPYWKKEVLKELKKGNLPLQFFEIIQSSGDPASLFNYRYRETERIVQNAYSPIEGEINLFVDTIHASKGREADIVVLADAMTGNIWRDVQNGLRDSELRVFYVGITRARKAVFIVPLQGFKPFLTCEVESYDYA